MSQASTPRLHSPVPTSLAPRALHRSGDPNISYMIDDTYRVHYGVEQIRACTPWVSPLSLYSLTNRRRGVTPNMRALERRLLRTRRFGHTLRRGMNGNKEVLHVRNCSEWKNKHGGTRRLRDTRRKNLR